MAISPLVSAACDFSASPVLESEVPSSYTTEQITAKSEIFSKILALILGTEQMTEDEFCTLKDETSSYTSGQKEVTDLILRETWILISGSNQMSQDEYDALFLKYEETTLPPVDPETTPVEEPGPQSSDAVIEDLPDVQQTTVENSTPPPVQEDSPQTEKVNNNNNQIVLNANPPEEKNVPWILYTFTAFCIFIIILLALRKL